MKGNFKVIQTVGIILIGFISLNAQISFDKNLDTLIWDMFVNKRETQVASLAGQPSQTNVLQALKYAEGGQNLGRSYTAKQLGTDTLFVGPTIKDTVFLTGEMVHNGHIIVFGGGVLKVKKANLTNYGDIFVMGEGQVLVDSSTLSFPQEYFYQRGITAIQNAQIKITNSFLDYSNLSHNLFLANRASMIMQNVRQNSFTTAVALGAAKYYVNNSDKVGEIIIKDSVSIDIRNSKTALLWHHIPTDGKLDWSFGKSDTALKYKFGKNSQGVKQIEYSINVDTLTDVMWALMPSSGSDVNIKDSKIRAIGLWFDKKDDTISISGLYDSTQYAAFTTPIDDRSLKITNSYVQTWSLYGFKNAVLKISDCNAGEIGLQGTSKILGSKYVVDGTGGYHWTTDTTTALVDQIKVYSYARSEQSSFFIVNNSTVLAADAIGQSILILNQTLVSGMPTPKGKSCIWYNYIYTFPDNYADSLVVIGGSSWIDKTSTSDLMDFKSWSLFYQRAGASNWISIAEDVQEEKRNELLAVWNTKGLSVGVYYLKMVLSDNLGNHIDAYAAISLRDKNVITHWGDKKIESLGIYPNPGGEYICFENIQDALRYDIMDVNLNVVMAGALSDRQKIDISNLKPGCYMLKIQTSKGLVFGKYVKQ